MVVLLGVDVGTSACKVTAIDDRGTIIASAVHGYAIHYPHPGWAEQNPEDWYKAACQGIQDCLALGNFAPQDVVGLSIDGPAHNVALLAENGQVLYPTIHWSDLRSVRQSEYLEASHGEAIYKITYQRVNPSWTLSQLLWLKENEKSVWARLKKILVTKDYVRSCLTGDYKTDIYDAIGTQLYDIEANQWSAELCALLGFPVEQLPEVTPSDAIAGTLQCKAANDTGLLEGTPVAVGSGDSVVEACGIGVVDPGQCIIKLGTAANVNLVTDQALPSHETITYRHLVNGRFFTIAPTNSGTSTIEWFRETFAQQEVAQAIAHGQSVYELIGHLAEEITPGCEGLLFHPYLMGERSPYWDPNLRGDFVGISAHHRRHHFARAVLEGVAYSVRDCLGAVSALNQPMNEWRLLGGGARSPLWRRILCDVLGRPLIKPEVDDAAFGAALLAGIAVGVFSDWDSAVRACVRIEETLQPDPESHALYSEYFEVYRQVTHDLAQHSHRLAALAMSVSQGPRLE